MCPSQDEGILGTKSIPPERAMSDNVEESFQATLLTVHELNLLSHGLKRDRFKKSELQTIVTKLMAVS